MEILLIEAVAGRRVAIAKHLARAGHRVTLSDSVCEAREVLQFIDDETEAPQAVVIGESLTSADGDRFREELKDRFPAALWVPLRADLGLDWLGSWLKGPAARSQDGADNVIPFPIERRGFRFERSPPFATRSLPQR